MRSREWCSDVCSSYICETRHAGPRSSDQSVRSFDHLGYGEKSVFGLGSIGKHLVPDAAFGNDIVAQAHFVRDDRGHRLDAIGIHLPKLFDPAPYTIDLSFQMLEIGRAHV